MVPYKGPLPSLQGSEVWALGFYGVYQLYVRVPPILKNHVTTLKETPPLLRRSGLVVGRCLCLSRINLIRGLFVVVPRTESPHPKASNRKP